MPTSALNANTGPESQPINRQLLTNGNGNGTAPFQPPIISKNVLSDESVMLAALLRRGQRSKSGKHNLSITPEEENAVAIMVQRDVEDAYAAIAPYRNNLVELTKNWRGTVDEKDFPFKGAANLRQPLTSSYVEQMKARFIKAILGADVITRFEALDREIKPEELNELNQWFQYELTEVVKLRAILESILHNVLVYGFALPSCSYQHREKMLCSTRRFRLEPQRGLTEQIQVALSQCLDESQENEWGTDERPTFRADARTAGRYILSDGGYVEFSIEEMGGPIENDEAGGQIQGASYGGTNPEGQEGSNSAGAPQMELVAKVERRETTFDGVKIDLIRNEDLCIINSAPTIEELPFFGSRYWLSVEDFRRGLETGFYSSHGQEEDERIARLSDSRISDYIPQEQTWLEDREEGTDSRDSQAYYPTRRYLEVYKWEGWWVKDPSGEPYGFDKILQPANEYSIHMVPRGRVVIKFNRLEEINKDGKRSPVLFGFIKEPGRFFRMGLAEWVKHSQAELDAVHNQHIDAGLLTNVPFGFYEPATGMKFELFKIEPGTMYPVKNAQGVSFPRLNWNATISLQQETLIKRYAGEQAGLTDPALGQSVSKRQSASEFVGTATALDLRTELIVEDLLDSLRELLYRILGLYQQFCPRRRIFRASGEDGVTLTKRFERDRLQGRLLLRLTGNLAQANEQLMRQTSVDMLQLLLNQILVQAGIVKADTIYGAIKLVAKLMNYKDVPLHKPDSPPESDTPSVEHHQMRSGIPTIGPTANENFNEHLQAHLRLASDPHIQELLPPAGMQALQQHILATVQMQEQVQLLRQQQAAMAVQMASSMAEKGIRPGKAGGQQPGENKSPGTAGEGVQGAPPAQAAA